MPLADLAVPRRLLAGGGPSTPDERVLRALATPPIGQFDPTFTQVMDEVMQLARALLLTHNRRCYAISALPSAGVEALLNTLPEDDARFVVAMHLDPTSGEPLDLRALADAAHARGRLLLVDATHTLGGVELRTDEWHLDGVVAGVDYCLGAPSGMTLVTYTDRVEQLMLSRTEPPRTSYLDLLQLQAYWSPERLNHHTAPTSLVYGLREALRLAVSEGLPERWQRHASVAAMLRDGLTGLGLRPAGTSLLTFVEVADDMYRRLRDVFGISISMQPDGRGRLGLLGADARVDACNTILAALAQLL
jgi:aspartate aminotransferase-like enzyme